MSSSSQQWPLFEIFKTLIQDPHLQRTLCQPSLNKDVSISVRLPVVPLTSSGHSSLNSTVFCQTSATVIHLPHKNKECEPLALITFLTQTYSGFPCACRTGAVCIVKKAHQLGIHPAWFSPDLQRNIEVTLWYPAQTTYSLRDQGQHSEDRC